MFHPMISFPTKITLLGSLGLLIIVSFFLFHSQKSKWQSYADSLDTSSSLTVQRAALRDQLDPAVYDVIVNKATERPFSSPLNEEKRPGTFVAADTGEPVFRSEQKFDSGTGWPSFTAPLAPDAVLLADDYSLLGRRTEVLSRAGGHLGHVFDDGPAPTGKRYCINGLALRFIPDEPEVETQGK